MATETLKGLKIAVLATDGFEQAELTEPRKALDAAGADTEIVSPKDKIRGWKAKQWSDEVAVDRSLDGADAADYDALVLPGGVINADALRVVPKAVAFVKAFIDARKPIGVICHGSWILIEAGGVRAHRMTSWPTLKSDLENAGAKWVDEQVVVDGPLVSSRKPDDIPAFNRELINLFSHAKERARPAA
ncbi:MAG TPA: type 1 glutamine amidotransferase domain-containing protein [Steroidobacteraceae bacterium]|jgi:protease I